MRKEIRAEAEARDCQLTQLLREEAHSRDDGLVQSIIVTLDTRMFHYIMTICREQCHSPFDYDPVMPHRDPPAPPLI